jgi:hypothetical protein
MSVLRDAVEHLSEGISNDRRNEFLKNRVSQANMFYIPECRFSIENLDIAIPPLLLPKAKVISHIYDMLSIASNRRRSKHFVLTIIGIKCRYSSIPENHVENEKKPSMHHANLRRRPTNRTGRRISCPCEEEDTGEYFLGKELA